VLITCGDIFEPTVGSFLFISLDCSGSYLYRGGTAFSRETEFLVCWICLFIRVCLWYLPNNRIWLFVHLSISIDERQHSIDLRVAVYHGWVAVLHWRWREKYELIVIIFCTQWLVRATW